MAFPFIFSSNFAAGTNAEWDSESDTGSLLSFPHYSTLAAIPGMPAPYRGAYCMWIDLRAGNTSDHVLVEGDIDIATGAERFFRWYMYLDRDFVASANDNFSVFELQQAGGTQVYTVGFTITATTDAVTVWVGEADTPETTSSVSLPKGQWFCLEVQANVDTAAANGDITVYLNGSNIVSLATPVQNAAAVGRGVLGTQNTLSTTTGSLLFAEFDMDDARLYPFNSRFSPNMRLTKTHTVFVGPGWVESAALISTTGTLDLYDTDTANINDASAKKVELNAAGNFNSHSGPLYFERGCYAVLGGTNPQGDVQLMTVPRLPGMHGPLAHWGDGAIRNYASKRVDRPQNV